MKENGTPAEKRKITSAALVSFEVRGGTQGRMNMNTFVVSKSKNGAWLHASMR